MPKQKNPFDGLILDQYEQEIENSITQKKDPFNISKKDQEAFAQLAAKHKLFSSSKRINIRIKTQDLVKVKVKAKNHNIPYQTLLSALIHQYADNRLNISL